MNTNSVSSHDWGAVVSYLSQQLQGLPREGFISVDSEAPTGAPTPGTSRRSGLLGWLSRPKPAARIHPLIQFLRDDEYLQAECSGPDSRLQTPTAYAWTADQQDQLLALGWEAPDPLDDVQMFRWITPLRDPAPDPEVSPHSSGSAAGLLVGTLRDVFGLADPSGLQITVDQFR